MGTGYPTAAVIWAAWARAPPWSRGYARAEKFLTGGVCAGKGPGERTPHAMADALPHVVLRREAAEPAAGCPEGGEALEAEEAHKVAHFPIPELAEPVLRVALSPAGGPRRRHRQRAAVAGEGVLPDPVGGAPRERA